MKFFIVLIFAFVVCGSVTAQTNVGIQDYGPLLPIQWDPTNEMLVSLLDSSIQNILPSAISAGQISSGNWTLSKVNNVGSGEMDETMYQFNVDISDGTGDMANLVIDVVLGPAGKVKFCKYKVLKQ